MTVPARRNYVRISFALALAGVRFTARDRLVENVADAMPSDALNLNHARATASLANAPR
jgi:hypothetical protein